ncbi:TolC family protein, partial [Allopontixanthobacter sp.]|uniref:TolC family protein n=1 Tax=Allopontixanthobacter sp. TaxID=2906452 RepID=UPI002ABB4DF8
MSAGLIQRKSMRLAGPLAAALALGGCGLSLTNSDLPAADIPVPEEWSTGAAPLETSVTDYWLALDDPVLEQFVALAAQNNLDLAQAAARLSQAREALVIARAGRLPAATANGGVSREVGDFAEQSLQFSVGADVSWEADLFGQITGSVNAASADLASAGYSLADLQRVIIGTVARSTISARSTAAQLAIARDTLVNQDDNLQIARWRNQAGLVSSLDVEQARVQRAQTAASIPALESDLVATANSISTLIGEPPGRVLALLDVAAPIPQPPKTVGLAAPAEVLRRRPDVRAAEANLLADTARINVARAQLLPLVRLTGTVGSGSVGIGNLFEIITGNLFAGVSQLIFDGGRTRAQVGSAEAAAEGSL